MTRAGWAAAGVTFLTFGLGSASTAHRQEVDFTSHWRGAEITVDGSSDEWPELTRVGKTPLSAAFVNDGEALYVCVVTSDPDARRIARRSSWTRCRDSRRAWP